MKINVVEPLRELDGSVVREKGVDVTFRTVIISALMVPTNGEKGPIKFDKFKLAMRITDNDVVVVSIDPI